MDSIITIEIKRKEEEQKLQIEKENRERRKKDLCGLVDDSGCFRWSLSDKYILTKLSNN